MKAPSRDNIPESEGMYFESTSLLFKYVGGFIYQQSLKR